MSEETQDVHDVPTKIYLIVQKGGATVVFGGTDPNALTYWLEYPEAWTVYEVDAVQMGAKKKDGGDER
jgi:hypothetical protein